MQTALHEALCTRVDLQDAEAMIQACVHCGFCNATCPTYQLLGDELDGPRGRIYLVRDMLAENRFSRQALRHLDRCLNCRSCETTCPSGVTYARLLDRSRGQAEALAGRPLHQRLVRRLLQWLVPWPHRFGRLLALGQFVRPFLPRRLARGIPARQHVVEFAPRKHARRVLLLDGCVQSAATPATNAALVRLLDRLGIEAITTGGDGCCGALDHHLTDAVQARAHMRRLIDRSWFAIEGGVEAILSSASGCGVHLKEYDELLQGDSGYRAKAIRFKELVRDPGEFLARDLERIAPIADAPRVAWHAPCSLQHGQKLDGVVEALLLRLGLSLTAVADAHLCCGSAGSYSLLQPRLARQLRARKLEQLEAGAPEVIVTANVGCQLYLAGATDTPVMHWVELVEQLCAKAQIRSAASAADPSVRGGDSPPGRR